jgi:BirA family biotin operon repressor/biotin-[acetyl-CoA-carboxylase] ligase
MDQLSLDAVLADLHLPAVRFFNSIDSTNDEAWRWVRNGAPHAALVIADQQTAGRGRMKRQWLTVAGAGLAFSLILHSPPLEPRSVPRLNGLGALAACQALASQYSLPAQVKWPNDILLQQRKAGGVLVETWWNGDLLQTAVIGIGINIAPQSLEPHLLPPAGLRMPAISVESVLGKPVDRLILLHAILERFFAWLSRLSSPGFIHLWENHLAYRDQWVELTYEAQPAGSLPTPGAPRPALGKVIGLNSDGALKLLTESGKIMLAHAGEVHLRSAATQPG